MKFLFNIAFFVLLNCLFLKAEIVILNIQGPTSSSSCDAIVDIKVSGTAGPFNIEVVETGEIVSAAQGVVTLENLCAGALTINVSPIDFAQCVTQLTAIITVNPSLTESPHPPAINTEKHSHVTNVLPEALQSENEISIFPNPSRGQISIYLDSTLPANSKIEVYNSLGVNMYTEKTQNAVNKKDYNFTTFPTGQYFLVVTPLDGNPLRKAFIIN